MSFQNNDVSHDFHMWLGYCISNWAAVESLVFDVFLAAMECPRKQAAIIYYRTQNLSLRLDLANELVPIMLEMDESKRADALKEWKGIYKEIKDLLGTRNRLAHHPVKIRDERAMFDDGVGFDDGTGFAGATWAESYVTDDERLRGKYDEKPALKIGNLKIHRAGTQFVILRIFNFLKETVSALPPRRVSSGLPNPSD
jgi:hypothetical protein